MPAGFIAADIGPAAPDIELAGVDTAAGIVDTVGIAGTVGIVDTADTERVAVEVGQSAIRSWKPPRAGFYRLFAASIDGLCSGRSFL